MNIKKITKYLENDIKGQVLENKDVLIRRLRQDKNPRSLWGAAPTGPIHLGYLHAFNRLKGLINLGFRQKVIVADFHSFLNRKESNLKKIKLRSKYYESCLNALGFDEHSSKVEFIHQSSFLKDSEYFRQVMILSEVSDVDYLKNMVTISTSGNIHASSVIAGLMKLIDLHYFNITLGCVGSDELSIYKKGDSLFKKAKLKRSAYWAWPVLMGVDGNESHASQPWGHISIHDGPTQVREKVNSCFVNSLYPERCTLMSITKLLILPYRPIQIGSKKYTKYEDLKTDFINSCIDIEKFKEEVSKQVIKQIQPIQEKLRSESTLINKALNSYE